jgi:hypothetical protein
MNAAAQVLRSPETIIPAVDPQLLFDEVSLLPAGTCPT